MEIMKRRKKKTRKECEMEERSLTLPESTTMRKTMNCHLDQMIEEKIAMVLILLLLLDLMTSSSKSSFMLLISLVILSFLSELFAYLIFVR